MKYYSAKKIREYIETHKDEIKVVRCGMREDWSYSNCVIYTEHNGYLVHLADDKQFYLLGIPGSTWATPVLRVFLKNGEIKTVEVFDDDKKETPDSVIREQKNLCKTERWL